MFSEVISLIFHSTLILREKKNKSCSRHLQRYKRKERKIREKKIKRKMYFYLFEWEWKMGKQRKMDCRIHMENFLFQPKKKIGRMDG